jgi:hypothetical protein
MDDRTSHFERFLKAVHRRAVAVRLAESAGIGLIVASGLAIVLLAIFIAMGRDGWALSLILLPAGALAGLVGGFWRLPTLTATAIRADRQLRLHDLLSTAIVMRDASDPWAALVIKRADESARSLRAGDVILRRLSPRAWGGIGICAAVVGVMSLFNALPDSARATDQNEPATISEKPAGSRDQIHRGASVWTAPGQTEASSPSHRQLIPDQQGIAANGTASGAAGRGASPGAGEQSAETPQAPAFEPAEGSGSQGQPGTQAGTANPSGSAPGESSPGSSISTNSNAKVTGEESSPSANPVGPDTASALEGPVMPVPMSAVPDAYRDVVRHYFSPSNR